MLRVMQTCPSWTGSVPQFTLKQPALLFQIEAEVREGTGEVMDGAHLERRVAESAADENVVLDAAISLPIKCTQPPNQVHLGTVKHF